jgi:DNA-directed RNA polymerase II subunit RPB1|uniref:DNA-directed RNA polymerase n=1 Tax=viral metagenome TaxID=1070528 RepID=A0A6C0C0C6_9ZZZZ
MPSEISEMKSSKVIGVQFSILSPEEIRNGSVAEITSRETYVNNKPVIGGLFDPRMGVLDPGLICPTDGLNYMKTPGYFGHMELAKPVFYIQYLNTIIKILRCVCIRCSNILISKKKYKYLLDIKDSRKRWQKIFSIASKIERCGENCNNGCNCKQPKKIYKEGLSTLIAEWPNKDGIADDDGIVKDKITMKFTAETVLKIFRRISDDDVSFLGFSPVWSRPDWMICQVLAVPPPSVRPSVKHDSQQRSEDDISHIIVNIIKANKTLQEKIQANAASKVIDDWATVLQYYVATMVDNRIPGVASVAQRSGRPLKSIKERLVGKTGRVRGNLMGKRVDYSSRSVITPDASIGIEQLGVPIKVAKNITFPEKINKRNLKFMTKLLRNGPDNWPGAKILERKDGQSISLRYVDRNSINLEPGDTLHRHLLDGDPVLFNRQPTLHRMSMMCHIAKVMKEGLTFRMNVADTKPYNADFDGDEMNMHGPQDYEAVSELKNLAAVSRQIISPANNKSIVGIFQDSLLSAYRLTREDINFDTRHAMNLLMKHNEFDIELFSNPDKLVTSFELLSQILPPFTAKFSNGRLGANEDKKVSNNIIEIVNGTFKRGQLNKGVFGSGSNGLLQSIFNDFGHKKAAKFINALQDIVTEYMKLTSYSVGISDLISNMTTNNKIRASITKKKNEVKSLIDQTHIGVFENNTGKSNEIEFETRVNSILNQGSEEAGKIGRNSLGADNRFVIMVNAGSKGSTLNIAQMISCLGQQNVDGKRIPYGFENRTLPHFSKYNDSPEARGFVESSFIGGLTPEELWFHAMGGRTGLIDTAVKTSSTGYIQRRLIKSMEDLKIHYDMTVRNSKNRIVQFRYGDDGIDPTKIETQHFPLSKMTIEDIYARFQIPGDDLTDALVTTNFTKSTIKRLSKQKTKLVEKTKEIINYMIDIRDLLVTNVFKGRFESKVHLPINISRITGNIEKQMHIQKDSMVDITPLECYKMVEKSLLNLNKLYHNSPTELFKAFYMFNMSPKELLTVRRYNKKALILLLANIETIYKKSIVNPGEMVGMIAAQSIGEPTTQLTLNTFHMAGVASKSNVTRGLGRIEEILSLSENPKNPSITVCLKEHENEDVEKAQKYRYILEYTCLRDVVDTVSICFDPDDMNSLIEDDKVLMETYHKFSKIMEECNGGVSLEEDVVLSKWIVRLEINREKMLDRNISIDDIHFAIKNSYKKDVKCIFNDYNDDKLVFRLRLADSITSSKKKSLDQTDEIYKLKNFQQNILDNIILRGIKNIPKVILRKSVGDTKLSDGNYSKCDTWVLDTVGTNLKDILSTDFIDNKKSFSNDIQEVYRTLGIEAARQTIYNEFVDCIEFNGSYINHRHLSLLCDRMTVTEKMVSVFRHGINNDDIGPIAKASFEETPEMFLRAARHAELDPLTGVSANIMCGQEGNFGTSAFQVMLDIQKIQQLESKNIKEKINIESQLDTENSNDPCSKQNIEITNTATFISSTDMGQVDDEYDPGF